MKRLFKQRWKEPQGDMGNEGSQRKKQLHRPEGKLLWEPRTSVRTGQQEGDLKKKPMGNRAAPRDGNVSRTLLTMNLLTGVGCPQEPGELARGHEGSSGVR